MDINIFQEDDGSFGARLVLGDEVIFAQGDTMELLREDIRGGVACAFDGVTDTSVGSRSDFLKSTKPMIQFFHPSLLKDHAVIA